jgi:hypothetical protein
LPVCGDHVVERTFFRAAPGKSDNNHYQILEISGKPTIIAAEGGRGKFVSPSVCPC